MEVDLLVFEVLGYDFEFSFLIRPLRHHMVLKPNSCSFVNYTYNFYIL